MAGQTQGPNKIPDFFAVFPSIQIQPIAMVRKLLLVSKHDRGLTKDVKAGEIACILELAKSMYSKGPRLLEIESPVNICGDTHGQYADLLRLFQKGGFPPTTNYLFLGDYVDRGVQNLETILLLFSYALMYPGNFFLLRGNHEFSNINRVYGFYEECYRRYNNVRVWELFQNTFRNMPLVGLVSGRILCMHGGLSPLLKNIDQLRKLPKDIEILQEKTIEMDLCWADPLCGVEGFHKSPRGASVGFGESVVKQFCERTGVDLIARGHQVVQDGYEFFADRRLVTIFSAPFYCGQFNNSAAMMVVDRDLKCSFIILRPSQKVAFVKGGSTSRPIKHIKHMKLILDQTRLASAAAVYKAAWMHGWEESCVSSLHSSHMDVDKETAEHREMRRVAFFAIVISTAAVIASVVTLPMLASYVQSFQSHLIQETDFCKTRARDMWVEIHTIRRGGNVDRTKRAAGNWLFGGAMGSYGAGGGGGGGGGGSHSGVGSYGPVVNAEPGPQCCHCQQGPAGPPGPPGDDGPHGNDGANGAPGKHGNDGQIIASAIPPSEPCVICPPGPPGPAGGQGQKGPQGPKGKDAENGKDGVKGETGMIGPPGAPGEVGPEGPPGPTGQPGRVVEVNGPVGPAGPRGPPGEPGEAGVPGVDGRTEKGGRGEVGDKGAPGPPGKQGPRGPRGPHGPLGEEGSCDHCPIPRTPPGY